MRLPTYKELLRFVEVEGWEDKDSKSHKTTGDHHRYVFMTPTGERLYTRVSHGRDEIRSPGLFTNILQEQLCIDAEQFWASVDSGVKPMRPMPASTQQRSGIELKLARNLISKLGMDPKDLAKLTQEDAVKIWNEWLTSGGKSLSLIHI